MKAFVGWLRAAGGVLAQWFRRGANATERKRQQRQATDQKLRRDTHRRGVEEDRMRT